MIRHDKVQRIALPIETLLGWSFTERGKGVGMNFKLFLSCIGSGSNLSCRQEVGVFFLSVRLNLWMREQQRDSVVR